MTIISLNGVDLEYPIYSVRAQSLRNAVVSLAVGGKLLKNGRDVVYVKALQNITFSLFDGDRLGIVGHNGAGKSTLLKVLAGVYEPTRGTISVTGRISSMVDIGLGLDWNLTGRENILSMGRMRGFTLRQMLAKVPSIIEFSELGKFIDLPIKTYSAGMNARLVFSVATNLDPDILLMDEWIGAGDGDFIKKATERMQSIVDRSRVIALATHSPSLVREVCNKLLVLEGGEQVYFGAVADWDFDARRPLVRLESLA